MHFFDSVVDVVKRPQWAALLLAVCVGILFPDLHASVVLLIIALFVILVIMDIAFVKPYSLKRSDDTGVDWKKFLIGVIAVLAVYMVFKLYELTNTLSKKIAGDKGNLDISLALVILIYAMCFSLVLFAATQVRLYIVLRKKVTGISSQAKQNN